MGGNKPHSRYQIIDRKLSSGKKFTWKQLADACQCELGLSERPSESTIRHDIIFLRRQHHAPIPKDRSEFYQYSIPNFSIFNSPLSGNQIENLARLRQMLDQFKELPGFAHFDDVLLRLEQHAGFPTGDKKSKVAAPISFERIDVVQGFEHLRTLYEAILGQRMQVMEYQKYGSSVAKTHRFHPWFLKEFNHRWSVFGWDEEAQAMKTFSLDRIVRLKTGSSVYRPSDFDFEAFFRHRIGVWQESESEKVETVRLRLSRKRAPYLETKPLHGSQRVVRRGDFGVDFEFRLFVNRQLEAKILEFGEDVEVLAPKHLRERIFEVLQSAVEKYLPRNSKRT